MINAKKLTVEQLGRLLYRRDRKEPRRNLKRYLKDLGGDGSADELDAVLVVAEKNAAAVDEAKRLNQQREITSKTVDAGVNAAAAEMITAIRVRMADTAMTQQDLADSCGWQQPMVAAYLTGKKSPGLENLARIAEALGCQWRLVEGGPAHGKSRLG